MITTSNKNIYKAAFAFLCSAFVCLPIYATNVSFNDGKTVVSADYFQSAAPGDAVFVRLNFHSGQTKNMPEVSASLELYKNDKKISGTKFYALKSEKADHDGRDEFLAGIPLSTYLSENDKYFLKVLYTLDKKQKNFELPLRVVKKDFIEEVIPLNAQNTAIRTDGSSERMQQIERLNKVFATTDTGAIRTLRPFITPVKADTRRSSFFGDRRTYAYSDGKKATALHYGTDYAVPTGTTVIAPADGKVVLAENRITTGWSVVVEHLPGLYSIYYHMSRLDVETGKEIKQGDVLGLSGATGMVTGPHLHWEVRLLTEAVSTDFFVGNFIP